MLGPHRAASNEEARRRQVDRGASSHQWMKPNCQRALIDKSLDLKDLEKKFIFSLGFENSIFWIFYGWRARREAAADSNDGGKV